MKNFYLSDLIKATGGSFIIGDPHLPIKKIGIDSRAIEKGSVFVAIKGQNRDGHDFIKDAIEKQVSAIIYSRDDIDLKNAFSRLPSLVKVDNSIKALGKIAKAYLNKFSELKKIAITGSNGKTTSKEMLTSILSKRAKTLCNEKNYNNNIGLPLTIFNLNEDTKYGVFEIGTSGFGEIKELSQIISPHCGLLTNIGDSHLESFKTRKKVLEEKKDLIEEIQSDGFIAINNDNPYLHNYIPKINKKIITFGLYNNGTNLYAKNIKCWLEKPQFDLYADGKFVTVELPMKGKHNIQNALGAAAVAYGLGFSLEEIGIGLNTFNPPKMRMQTEKLSSGTIIINDAYNANPSSMKTAIDSLEQSYPDKKITLVLSDMLELGDNTNNFHSELGTYINSLSNVDSVYLTGTLINFTKEKITEKQVKYFINNHILAEELEKDCNDPERVIFIKASRGMKLDSVFDEIMAKQKK